MIRHHRSDMAKQTDNIARKKPQSTLHLSPSQNQLIHPTILQQAIKNPQTARPETILQLQRT